MTEDPCSAPQETAAPDAPARFRKPGLVLVSTPIGNLGDISARAVAALRQADLILCEDTRTSARLLRHFDVRTRTESLHDHNEGARVGAILARIADGALVALISDAGTPLVSDPGFRLVRAAIEAGVAVSAAPGANAAVMALTLSGLPPHPFLFMGFLPTRQAARTAALGRLRAAELSGLSATMVFYESPHRAGEALADMAAAFGDRPAALTRELTKLYEEVRRGGLVELAGMYAQTEPRGEVTIVVGPADEAPEAVDLDALLTAALKTQSVREAAAGVAEATGLPRKVVYARALALRDQP
jgi:16S rRNA (cytidine1402-2'-O)-methyltransferase